MQYICTKFKSRVSRRAIVEPASSTRRGVHHVEESISYRSLHRCHRRWPLARAAGSRCSAKDIVDTAVAAGSFKTLAKALAAADLVDDAEGAGPVHGVRADRRGVREAAGRHARNLLKPENKAKLRRILTYHVVAGKRDGGATW